MERSSHVYILLVVILLLAPSVQAAILDVLVLGDEQSEKSHKLQAENSQIKIGGLDEKCRVLLPYEEEKDYGGKITFTVKCDPIAQNYITVKFWGSDYGGKDGIKNTRLYLFHDGKQFGYRVGGDWPMLDDMQNFPEFPGRFKYNTMLLPLELTKGKDELTFEIQVWGGWYAYGGGYEKCQQPCRAASRGIYKIYTHTESFIEPPAGEKQGAKPDSKGVRGYPQGPYQNVLKKKYGNNRNNFPDPGDLQSQLDYLKFIADLKMAAWIKSDVLKHAWTLADYSQAYNASWSKYHRNEKILEVVAASIDHFAQRALKEGYEKFGWHDLGCVAEAYIEVADALENKGLLSKTLDPLNLANVQTRKKIWAHFFQKGLEWRADTIRFPHITNQVMHVSRSIYSLHKAIQMIDPENAWPEERALDILYQVTGVTPFKLRTGDIHHGQWSTAQLNLDGDWDYTQHTAKGLGREMGYVAYYGENGWLVARFAEMSGDPKLKAQAIKVNSARSPFRYLGIGPDGFDGMHITASIGWRHNHETSRIQYQILNAEIADILRDPVSIRVLQLYLKHNRVYDNPQHKFDYFKRVNHFIGIKNIPVTDYRLPMELGQPDFAWADEESAVIAAKYNENRLFVNLFYRTAVINNMARIQYTTEKIDRIANIAIETQFDSAGYELIRADNVSHSVPGLNAPDAALNLHSFHGGDSGPVAVGPHGGRGDFYRCEYGKFLIGMNCTKNKKYTLRLPDNHTSKAKDLINGNIIDLAKDPVVLPNTTMVLILED